MRIIPTRWLGPWCRYVESPSWSLASRARRLWRRRFRVAWNWSPKLWAPRFGSKLVGRALFQRGRLGPLELYRFTPAEIVKRTARTITLRLDGGRVIQKKRGRV